MDDFNNINVSNMVKGDHIIKNVKGINIGIYKIDKDKYSVFKMTCPHMGGDLCFFKNKKIIPLKLNVPGMAILTIYQENLLRTQIL